MLIEMLIKDFTTLIFNSKHIFTMMFLIKNINEQL
jgi:hypothetical protein